MASDTEISQPFDMPFVVDEQALRSISNLLEVRLPMSSGISASVKFANGGTSTQLTIDEVLNLENEGSKRIVDVVLQGSTTGDPTRPDSQRSIKLEFEDLENSGGRSSYAVGMKLKDPSRDWVFTTAAEIREKLSQVKTVNPQRWLTSDYFYLSFLASYLIFILVLLPFAKWPDPPEYPNAPDLTQSVDAGQFTNIGERVRDRLRSGKAPSTAEAVIALAESQDSFNKDVLAAERNKRVKDDALLAEHKKRVAAWEVAHKQWLDKKPFWSEPQVIPAATLAAFLLTLLIRKGIEKLYPPYVFSWGGYQRTFVKIKEKRKFWFEVVFAGFAVTILGSFIFEYLKRPSH